jgi:hypothetical protein
MIDTADAVPMYGADSRQHVDLRHRGAIDLDKVTSIGVRGPHHHRGRSSVPDLALTA